MEGHAYTALLVNSATFQKGYNTRNCRKFPFIKRSAKETPILKVIFHSIFDKYKYQSMSCVKFLVSASCKRTTSEVVTIHNQKNLSILVEYPMYAKVNDNVVMFRIRNVMRLLQYEVLPLRRGFIY